MIAEEKMRAAGAAIVDMAHGLGDGDADLTDAVETAARLLYTRDDTTAAPRRAIELAADILGAHAAGASDAGLNNLSDAALLAAMNVRAALEDGDGDGSLIDGDLYRVHGVAEMFAEMVGRMTDAKAPDGGQLRKRVGAHDYTVLRGHATALRNALDGLCTVLLRHASAEMKATVSDVP